MGNEIWPECQADIVAKVDYLLTENDEMSKETVKEQGERERGAGRGRRRKLREK